MLRRQFLKCIVSIFPVFLVLPSSLPAEKKYIFSWFEKQENGNWYQYISDCRTLPYGGFEEVFEGLPHSEYGPIGLQVGEECELGKGARVINHGKSIQMKATHQATALKSDGTRVNSYKLVYDHSETEQIKILSRENSLPKLVLSDENRLKIKVFHYDGSVSVHYAYKVETPRGIYNFSAK